jgi:hypothetical protein
MAKYNFLDMPRDKELKMVCEKYPEVPRNFILKTDLARRGVNFTKRAIEELQDPKYEWTPSILFQWHGMDKTESYHLPVGCYFNDATPCGIVMSPPEKDPYTIDLIDDKFYVLSDDEILEEVNFYLRPKYYDKRSRTGKLLQAVGMMAGFDNICIVSSNHCKYFSEGLQCKFCDMDYNTRHQMKMGREFYSRITPEDAYDLIYEALKQKGKWRQCFITGGSDPRNNFENEVDFHVDIIKAIKQAAKDIASDNFPVNLLMTPLEEDQYIKLKEAGLEGFGCYFEIWDEEKFSLICPGKAKYVGRDKWLERSLNAVKIFGRGNVSAGWVPGIEMAPSPYGFEDIDEAVNSTLEGYKFLIEHGIAMAGSNWSIMPGSEFYRMGATPPPLEFYVKLDLGRYKLYKEYGGFREGEGAFCCDSMCRRSQPWSCYIDYQRLL